MPELLVLWEGWAGERVTEPAVVQLIRRDRKTARGLLRRLQQDELISGFSSGGRRLYRLGPIMQGSTGRNDVGPVITDLSLPQVEERIIAHLRKHGRIQRGDVETLSGMSRDQAYRLLRRLVEQGILESVGRGRGAYYQLATDIPDGEAE